MEGIDPGPERMELAAFEALVREHEPAARALAYSILRDPHGAEDAVQEAFLRAYRGLKKLRDPSRLKAWLFAIVRNASIDWLRGRRRVPAPLPNGAEALLPAPEPPSTDRREFIMEILRDMREDYRRLILLRFQEGMSYRELAEALGMTVGTVGEKLWRVRKLIAKRMEKAGERGA